MPVGTRRRLCSIAERKGPSGSESEPKEQGERQGCDDVNTGLGWVA